MLDTTSPSGSSFRTRICIGTEHRRTVSKAIIVGVTATIPCPCAAGKVSNRPSMSTPNSTQVPRTVAPQKFPAWRVSQLVAPPDGAPGTPS